MDKKNWYMGLGAVVRDHLGTMCAAKSLSRQGFLDPTSVEAMAALMAAQLCNVLGLLRIQLEGDAQVVVGAVNSMASNYSYSLQGSSGGYTHYFAPCFLLGDGLYMLVER